MMSVSSKRLTKKEKQTCYQDNSDRDAHQATRPDIVGDCGRVFVLSIKRSKKGRGRHLRDRTAVFHNKVHAECTLHQVAD
jgi:hypothetical protein